MKQIPAIVLLLIAAFTLFALSRALNRISELEDRVDAIEFEK